MRTRTRVGRDQAEGPHGEREGPHGEREGRE